MSSHYYIQLESMTGSRDGVTSESLQFKWNESFSIDNPVQVIAADMFIHIADLIDARYSESMLYNQLLIDGKHGFMNYNGDKLAAVISSDSAKNIYYYDDLSEQEHGIMHRHIYRVRELTDDQRCYIVVDEVTDRSAKTTIKKCYQPYFTNEDEALTYYGNLLSDYSSDGITDSKLSIVVKSIAELEQSDWYINNISIYDKIDRYSVDISKFRYLSDFTYMNELFNAMAYDNLPAEERIRVNKHVYEDIFSKYMDAAQAIEFDQFFGNEEYIDADTAEEYVNIAIGLVLSNAKSEDEFKQIHTDMGVYEYWIDNLTDRIFSQHPNKGYILASRNGELKWFSDEEAFCLGRWAGADEPANPYYGKFQANTSDTLLCYREFHPELIVDRFPPVSFTHEYVHRRAESVREQRLRHDEMRCDVDENDIEYYTGTWYPEGVDGNPYRSAYMDDDEEESVITFDAVYGTHTFTNDEARTLLSGEELEIKGYKSLKANIECTIHGQLKEESDMYSGETSIKFSRTDINMEARQAILARLEAENE